MSAEENPSSFEMMAATVVHEVKNPLSLARANIDYILLCDTEKKYFKNCNIIKEELTKASNMLSFFVDYLKPLSDSELTEQINIYEFLSGNIAKYGEALENKAKLELDCPERDIFVLGNPYKLSLVVSNIIKNSVEAITGQGSIKISVSREHNDIVIKFSDNGTGISEPALDEIKSGKFFTSKPYGNGLGVNICTLIIEEHGGTYGINNNEDGGCTVTVTLPVPTDS